MKKIILLGILLAGFCLPVVTNTATAATATAGAGVYFQTKRPIPHHKPHKKHHHKKRHHKKPPHH